MISPGAAPFSTQSTKAVKNWSCSRVGVWLAFPGSFGSGTESFLPLAA